MYAVDELIEQLDQNSDEGEILSDNENEDAVQTVEREETNEEAESKKVVKKSRKPSNRPKLDAERLKGPRGLSCMEKMFSEVKFSGHGHEKEDLQRVMQKLQYWCHRLFPKFSFDDTLEHLEKLGNKRAVITLKKKILFNMLVEDDSIVRMDQDDVNEQENVVDDFDQLLRDEELQTNRLASSSTAEEPSFFTQEAASLDEEIRVSSLQDRGSATKASGSSYKEAVTLTEEQKEIIARNRQLAAERRRARLEAQKQHQDLINQSEQSGASELPSSQGVVLSAETEEIIARNRMLAVEKRRARLEALKQNRDLKTALVENISSFENAESQSGDLEPNNLQPSELEENEASKNNKTEEILSENVEIQCEISASGPDAQEVSGKKSLLLVESSPSAVAEEESQNSELELNNLQSLELEESEASKDINSEEIFSENLEMQCEISVSDPDGQKVSGEENLPLVESNPSVVAEEVGSAAPEGVNNEVSAPSLNSEAELGVGLSSVADLNADEPTMEQESEAVLEMDIE